MRTTPQEQWRFRLQNEPARVLSALQNELPGTEFVFRPRGYSGWLGTVGTSGRKSRSGLGHRSNLRGVLQNEPIATGRSPGNLPDLAYKTNPRGFYRLYETNYPIRSSFPPRLVMADAGYGRDGRPEIAERFRPPQQFERRFTKRTHRDGDAAGEPPISRLLNIQLSKISESGWFLSR